MLLIDICEIPNICGYFFEHKLHELIEYARFRS